MRKMIQAAVEPEIVHGHEPPHIGKALFSEFTEREQEVLVQLISGASNKTIAERMNLSVDTVKYHLKNLLSKTGCQTRTELAVKVCRSGILLPEDIQLF